MHRLFLAAVLLGAAPAAAQTSFTSPDGRKWEPAPTGGPLSEGVAPVDRAGARGGRDTSAGPANSTPFSAAPTESSGSQTSPATRDAAGSEDAATPSLSR